MIRSRWAPRSSSRSSRAPGSGAPRKRKIDFEDAYERYRFRCCRNGAGASTQLQRLASSFPGEQALRYASPVGVRKNLEGNHHGTGDSQMWMAKGCSSACARCVKGMSAARARKGADYSIIQRRRGVRAPRWPDARKAPRCTGRSRRGRRVFAGSGDPEYGITVMLILSPADADVIGRRRPEGADAPDGRRDQGISGRRG